MPHAGGQSAKEIGFGVMQGPVAADLFEVRAEDIADETAAAGLPDSIRAAGPFQLVPDGPHDRVVEGDQRFRDAVSRAVLPEDIGVSVEQPSVFEDIDRVCDIRRLAFEITGHATASGVPIGHRSQDGQVQSGVAEVRFLSKEITRLAKERRLWIEDRTDDPVIEIRQVRRGVAAGELTPVSGRTTDDRIDHESQTRIGDLPELGGQAMIERANDQFQTGPTAQRRIARQQLAHEGQGGTAEQKSRPGGGSLIAQWPESLLKQ
ncbi:hypothetical protein AB0C27_20855 [Nonomuraea sp. NPDC048882]|uniref:hypothetical protein n=1 Tax=Nonomuraea sp. NPDC048882 TaxID=3154347 RepID=UPI0033E9FA81